MFNPFSRSPITAQDWQKRARLFQEQINGLSIKELMRGVDSDGTKLGELSGRGGHAYDPNQPRVPAGHSDGGQWTAGGGHSLEPSIPEVLSDALPENTWRPGAQYASRIRGRGGGLLSQATPAQLFRLSAAQAQAQAPSAGFEKLSRIGVLVQALTKPLRARFELTKPTHSKRRRGSPNSIRAT